MTFNETQCGNGVIEVEVGGRKLVCPVCQNATYHERYSLLNDRPSAAFNMGWLTGATAVNYVCANCAYVFWFLR
jgi:hypothetical protein